MYAIEISVTTPTGTTLTARGGGRTYEAAKKEALNNLKGIEALVRLGGISKKG